MDDSDEEKSTSRKSKIVRAAVDKSKAAYHSVECVACALIKVTEDPDIRVNKATTDDLLCSHHDAMAQLDITIPTLYASPKQVGAGGEKKKKPAGTPKHKGCLFRTSRAVPMPFKSFSVPGCAPRQFHVLSRPLEDDETLPESWVEVDVPDIQLRLLRKNHRLVPVSRCKKPIEKFVKRHFGEVPAPENKTDV